MIESLIYDGLVFACWLYAMLRGGAPERIGASILFFGSALTYAAVSGPAVRFASVEAGVFAVDVAALLGFLIVALCAERFWPLWITALQIIGTAGHAVKLVDPQVLRWGYAFALAFWSYPMLVLLTAATWRHQKRLRLYGVDRSWSSFSGRLGLGRRPGPPG
ncbi:MAG: hypothetical protein QOH04_2407 [Sphingomonadales bacterium]|jgi:hypothetical protein|nr:hypothetical protein [Sphingomonadales bacterium]